MLCASAAAWAAILLVISADEAHAYLDFSVGSFLLQGAIAAVVGAAVFCRQYARRAKEFLSRTMRMWWLGTTMRKSQKPADDT